MTIEELENSGKLFMQGFQEGIYSPSKRVIDAVMNAEPLKHFKNGVTIMTDRISESNFKIEDDIYRIERQTKARLWKRACRYRR